MNKKLHYRLDLSSGKPWENSLFFHSKPCAQCEAFVDADNAHLPHMHAHSQTPLLPFMFQY